jgi:hypothetical protein
MKLSFNKFILPFTALLLLFIIFRMIDYLAVEKYIVEQFSTNEMISNKNTHKADTHTLDTHTVDLPLTTRYSCKNFCGPTARCAITGHQCFTDIDCPGCQPYSSSLSKTKPLPKSKDNIPGTNDAGKLTVGVTPTYSPLTTGFGTREKIITNDMYAQPPQANFGVDTWGKSFNESQELFNRRYKPGQLQFMPNYPVTYGVTGEFITDGPLPSNY